MQESPLIRGFQLFAGAIAFECILATLAHAAEGKPTLASDFSDFVAVKIDLGPARQPDFRGRDRAYADYKTMIRQGIKAGPTFARKYSLIEIGCGAGCRKWLAVDLTTGHVRWLPVGGIGNPDLGLTYYVDSRLIDARWVDNGRCVRQKFTITAGGFDRSEIDDIGAEDICLEPDAK